MENIEKIKNDTIDLIDRLKAITFNAGLAGGGNEYIILVETFLYKFLNDKFIYEAKKWAPGLADAEDEQAFFEKQRISELYARLADVLSKQEREIFWLSVSGLSYEEIAEKLAIPSKSVDNAIQRARRKLRAVWSRTFTAAGSSAEPE